METKYPAYYHAAINHLVAFGGHGGGDYKRAMARRNIAKSLMWARRTFGKDRAQWERGHMLFISGQFPLK